MELSFIQWQYISDIWLICWGLWFTGYCKPDNHYDTLPNMKLGKVHMLWMIKDAVHKDNQF